jgi:hypothetical protein
MKEELFQLLDGDLPDDATAELLHILSVDPDKRSVFRQQLKLQGELHRNEGYHSMTPGEEAEMMDRLGRAIGAKEGGAYTSFRPGMLGIVLVCLLLGTGAGYLIDEWTGTGDTISTPPQTTQRVEQPVQAAPPVIMSTVDRDSLVAAVRDSVARAFQDSVEGTKVIAKPVVRKKVARRHVSVPSDGAVTGMTPTKHKRR